MADDVKIEYKDGNVIITMPYDGNPLPFKVSTTGKSRLIANHRFLKCENSPDPNLLVSAGMLSMVSGKAK